MVTVSPASPTAPTLFPLLPSGSFPDSGDITIGCMAKDFLPQTITFSWNDQHNASIDASKFKSFPPISNTAGTFTASSQAAVAVADWKNFYPFFCKADHSAGDKVIPIIPPQSSKPSLETEMLVRAPPILAFSSAYLNSTITCNVAHLCTDKTTLQWFKNGELLDSGFTTTKPASDGRSGYTIRSKLIVTKREWLANTQYSCKVENEKFNNTLDISKNAFCTGENPVGIPMVETIAPTFDEIYQTNSAKLTCRISNIPFDADLSLLDVTWTQGSNQKALETEQQQPTDQENDLQSIDFTASVCATEWNSGEPFTCKVASSGLFPEPIEKTLKKDNGGTHVAPSVYMFSPPLEELALKEKATIICLVKGFYPVDFFVKWLHNDKPVNAEEYLTSKPTRVSKASQLYVASSMLTINEQDWSLGDSFTCLVGHEALPFNTTQKTVDKSTGKPSVVNVSLVLSDAAGTCY